MAMVQFDIVHEAFKGIRLKRRDHMLGFCVFLPYVLRDGYIRRGPDDPDGHLGSECTELFAIAGIQH